MKPCNQLSIEGVREPEKGYRYELKAMALSIRRGVRQTHSRIPTLGEN
jgi:hypothetical protein